MLRWFSMIDINVIHDDICSPMYLRVYFYRVARGYGNQGTVMHKRDLQECPVKVRSITTTSSFQQTVELRLHSNNQ